MRIPARGTRPLDDKRIDHRPEELRGERQRVDAGERLDVDDTGIGEAEDLTGREVSGLIECRGLENDSRMTRG
jgi:hypothetical protein